MAVRARQLEQRIAEDEAHRARQVADRRLGRHRAAGSWGEVG